MGQSSDGRQTKPPGFQDLPWSGQTENPDLKPRTSHHRLAGNAAQHASPMGLPQSLAPEGTRALAVADTLVNSDVADEGWKPGCHSSWGDKQHSERLGIRLWKQT